MTTRPFVPRASRVLSDVEREQALAVLAVAFKIIGSKAPDEMVLKLLRLSAWLAERPGGQRVRPGPMLAAIGNGAKPSLGSGAGTGR
jgi:hypothetical protein